MGYYVTSQVFRHSPSEGGQLLVLLALAENADDDGYCWPKVATLAQKARLSERQVKRLLRNLVNDGEIEMPEGPRSEGKPFRVMPMSRDNLSRDADDTHGVTPSTPDGVTPTRAREESSVVESSKESPPGAVYGLFAEWQRVFDKPQALLSPARRRVLKKVLNEEPNVDVLKEALRGFRVHRDSKPGGIELGDIFGTFAGTGDLRSKIEWMRRLAVRNGHGPMDPEVRSRLLDYYRYTMSLPHRPARERGEGAKARLVAAGYTVIDLEQPPWARLES